MKCFVVRVALVAVSRVNELDFIGPSLRSNLVPNIFHHCLPLWLVGLLLIALALDDALLRRLATLIMVRNSEFCFKIYDFEARTLQKSIKLRKNTLFRLSWAARGSYSGETLY